MRGTLERRAAAALIAGSVALATAVSAAQAPPEAPPDAPPAAPMDPGWAEAARLLDEGRALMNRRGQLDRACEILAQSYALKQRGDTLINLAECHRRQGKTATAWREFDEAIRFAIHVAFPEAIEAAIAKRDELAKKLSVLVVEVDAGDHPESLEVLLDGKRLPPAQWNQVLYVDPGVHVVTTSGPEHEPTEARAEVPPRGGKTTLRVAPRAIPRPPPAAVVPPAPPVAPPPAKPGPTREPEETPLWPFVVGGAGLVLLGVATVFVVDSRSAGSELDDRCSDERQQCPVGYDFADARGRELRGFGLFVGLGVAGLGATTAGVLGLLAAGSDDEDDVAVTPWVGTTGAGVSVRGPTW